MHSDLFGSGLWNFIIKIGIRLSIHRATWIYDVVYATSNSNSNVYIVSGRLEIRQFALTTVGLELFSNSYAANLVVAITVDRMGCGEFNDNHRMSQWILIIKFLLVDYKFYFIFLSFFLHAKFSCSRLLLVLVDFEIYFWIEIPSTSSLFLSLPCCEM